jgi:hypothetical protein
MRMKPTIPLPRAISQSCAAALCVLLGGCGADQRGGPLLNSLPSTAETSVVVHMSGLLLVVPPGQDGGQTNVLMPTMPDHAAWLGFGIAGDEPFVSRLCLADATYGQPAIRAGICYVDLDLWSLQPFGAGGQPTPASNTLPAGVLNVTEGSGGGYRVHVPSLGGDLRAQVVFGAGEAGGHCSLASWIYEPVNAQGVVQRRDSLPLINVLDWEIRNPAVHALVFRSRSGPDSISVPLPAPDANGKIELLLTHIPIEDLEELPPARSSAPEVPADTAYHFDAFYDLLRDGSVDGEPIPRNSPRRPLPHTPTALSAGSCEVGITIPRSLAAEGIPPFEASLAIAGPPRSVRLAASLRPGTDRAGRATAAPTTVNCMIGGGGGW